MLGLPPRQIRYWFYTAPTDMRKGFDSLSGLVRNTLKRDPLTGDVFVFVSRQRMHIKLLYWDGDGFVLYYKRLEKGRFDAPEDASTARELKRDELLMLLEGVRLAQMQRKQRYQLPAS
jgi:transposase